MASTYTTNKSIEKPANGDYVNTWNVPNNNDWDIVDVSLGGVTTLNATGASGTTTLSVTQYRPPTIIVTGTLTANVTYSIPAGIGGQWVIYNATTGSYTLTIACGGGGTSVAVSQNKSSFVYSDGTNIVRGVSDITITAGGSSGQVQYNSSGSLAGSANFTFDGTNLVLGATVAGELRIRNTIKIYGATSGYAGFTVPAAAGSTVYSLPTADGTGGQVLTTNGSGVLSWTNPGGPGGGVTSFNGGTTGLTPSVATSGPITLAGTLGAANGGTGNTTYTDGEILIGNSSGNTLTKTTITAGGGVTITNGPGSITLSAIGQPTMNIVSGTTQTAVTGNQYVLVNAATTTVTLPASPSAGDTVFVTVQNDLISNVVARNGSNIMGLAQDLTLDAPYASVQLRYANSTRGWVFT